MSKIYLDNNATTKCDLKVLNSMLPYLGEQFGNPSSIYSLGREVKEKVQEARRNISELIHAKEEEIIFTSCASEANVCAIMSAVRSNPLKKHIITTKVEHASIMETMKYLESVGYRVTYLSVDNYGRISLEEIKKSICDDTCLITVMMANNEIGNIYPVKEIGEIARRHHILFHCDAVQAIGKVPIDVSLMNIDTLSLAGHKIHAPKGIGVLYVKNGIPFVPLIFGHQEKNRRGGTENVPYIIGLGKAVEIILRDQYQSNKKMEKLRDYMEDEIKKEIDDTMIYGDLDKRLPNTSSIAFRDVDANQLMLLLESFDIFVSTGSACNSELAEASHVLVACGVNLEQYSPIRISLSKYNTKEEIDVFVKHLVQCISMIRRRK